MNAVQSFKAGTALNLFTVTHISRKIIILLPSQKSVNIIVLFLLTLGMTSDKKLFIRVLLKNHNISINYRTDVIEVSFSCKKRQ